MSWPLDPLAAALCGWILPGQAFASQRAPLAETHPAPPEEERPTPPHPPLLLPAGPNPGMGPAWSGCWAVRPPSTMVADIWAAHHAQQAPVLALADGGAVLDDEATVAFEVEEAEWVVPGDQL